jgi:EpsD family peptidyl-prolyl cis-trans isomerase
MAPFADSHPRARWKLPCTGLLMAMTLGLIAGCGNGKEKAASQVAARVNDSEISVHQVNFLLQQREVRQDAVEAARRQALSRLIDQELAVQKALNLKIDRQPAVLQALEAAKREVLARAYVERVAEAATPPSAAEMEKFYKDKPALFAERRVYQLQELNIELPREQLPELSKRLSAAKDMDSFTEYLRSSNIRYMQNRAVRAAEQLPLERLDEFAKMKDGQARLIPTPSGATVLVLVKSQVQPVELEKAKPAIEQYLASQRKRELVERDMKDLRTAAKIEYVGKFAEASASAPAANALNGPSEPDTPSTPAIAPANTSSIDQGMGVNK